MGRCSPRKDFLDTLSYEKDYCPMFVNERGKALMQTLINEYVRLSAQCKRADNTEARRSKQIIERAVLPAVIEMLSAIRMLWPDTDTSELLNIMEEGVNYADSNTGGNKRKLQPVHGRLGS